MNKRWISGGEILDRWQAVDFELFEAFKNGLSPYNIETGEVLRYKRGGSYNKTWEGAIQLKCAHNTLSCGWLRYIRYNFGIMYKLSEVEEYEQKHGIGPKAEPTQTPESSKSQLFPHITKWEDVTILITDKDATPEGISVKFQNDPIEHPLDDLIRPDSELADRLRDLLNGDRLDSATYKSNICHLNKKLKEQFPELAKMKNPIRTRNGRYQADFKIESLK